MWAVPRRRCHDDLKRCQRKRIETWSQIFGTAGCWSGNRVPTQFLSERKAPLTERPRRSTEDSLSGIVGASTGGLFQGKAQRTAAFALRLANLGLGRVCGLLRASALRSNLRRTGGEFGPGRGSGPIAPCSLHPTPGILSRWEQGPKAARVRCVPHYYSSRRAYA